MRSSQKGILSLCDTARGDCAMHKLFYTLEKGGNEYPHGWRIEGERPKSCISAMGSRVPA